MSGIHPPGGSSYGLGDQPPAVDFIERRGHQYHPALDGQNTRFEPGLKRFVPCPPQSTMQMQASSNLMVPPAPTPSPRPMPTPVNDMDNWADVFPRAMARLRKEEPEPQAVAEWGIRDLTTWKDVQGQLDKARNEYEKSTGKFERNLRQAFDEVTVRVKTFIVVIHVDMATPVVGVVGILIDAYNQASNVRSKTNSGVDGLRVSLAKMDFYLQMYPDDPVIALASTDLVVAMFKAIENAVIFYTSCRANRGFKAVFNGEKYGEKILQSLENVQSCCGTLEREAYQSFQRSMLQSTTTIIQEQRTCRQEIGNIGNMIQSAMTQSAMNAVMRVFGDCQQNWPIMISPMPSRPNTPQPVYLTPRDLWNMIGMPDIDDTDMAWVQANEFQIVPEDRGMAEQVIVTTSFRNWLNKAGSAKLLVHGDFDFAREISPFSILCVSMTWLFRQWTSRGIISLVFFCRRHTEHYRGGRAMIRSLISQLLRLFPFPTVQPGFEVSERILKKCTVDDLCNLFKSLLQQLPQSTTVFCLIESIDCYETLEFIDDMATVVSGLLELVNKPREMGARFKVLLTSPQPTREVRGDFDGERDTIIHAADLPVVLNQMGMAGFQEQLGGGGWGGR